MKQKELFSAYRSPRFSWKDVGFSLITLGLKKPKDIQEEAKLYKLILINDTLDIYEESTQGQTKLLETVHLDEKEVSAVKRRNRYYSDHHVYHLDRYA
ncbi:hypothetical protein [Alkalibacterium olivapovliticus]|uniref:Uncharacterized protein n=1 Tax=Alkalibacterium olivapovliticus TaxID=99907 RepID=A0A2T0VZT9_9LACT|nr:hypothetical protein [Alkalibacterium olivapovliticus]PRY78034.1 hypothetical protein CLV38_12724 [Alkalibacterium olivapovliticus]